ncbi:MAG TPA: MFS transporter [Vitreimonas sp.]|uniref:spinster family MFS transporter n=1 Tax=Vitreimonas sp. TaxID=3069702 RepID=UPI002D5BCF46|nr:MFS transporter [Vitreimonas sp.]HYD86162.1 MFS transporter [Vitreimonas sp.]
MTDAAAPAFQGFGTKNYRAYVLGALLVVYTFNFIDRIVVGILSEPIKNEFGLSDTELGLLGGTAFAILYTLLGIPIARLAERMNRMTILSVCVAIWSVMTAACGFAVNYATLFAARVGVSIGEAGCTPPANSIISDYFPADRRASALSIYALGIPIGSMIAAVGGGWIATNVGWREAFIWLGVPGVLLAIIVKLTVREPPRSAPAAEAPGFVAAFTALARKSTFWHIALGSALASFVGYGVGQYLTNFMIRTHGFSLFEGATLVGVVLGLCAAIGTFTSGFLADRISKRHPNALAWLPALGFVVATPMYVLAFNLTNIWLAMPALMLGAITHYFYLGPMYAVTQGVVAPRMRATAVAVLLFIVNLIGLGLGPPAIGALSDFLANSQLIPLGLSTEICADPSRLSDSQCASGKESGLRYAMMIGVLGYLWAGLHFLISARTLRRDWVA